MSAVATPAVRIPARRTWRWPLIIVGLLAAHVTGMVFAVVIATTDRSFVVLPNYYQRALEWDERKAATIATEHLGWQRSLRIEPTAAAGKGRSVTLRLVNASKQPIDGLHVRITAAPERKPDRVQTLDLKAAGDGCYVGPMIADVDGVWSFDIDAEHGSERYIATASPWIE
jgi:nitrogen fixation protein FixH